MPVKKKKEVKKPDILEYQKELEAMLKKQGTELVTQALLTHGQPPSMSIILRFKK